MTKSKLDILVERRLLTEKYTIASKAIDKYTSAQPGRFQFITELDSNKLATFTYRSDKEVDVFLVIILRNMYLHKDVINTMSEFIVKQRRSDAPPSTHFSAVTVEEFMDKHTLFIYRATIGGATVLNAMIKDMLSNFLAIEALKLEKSIMDYGR